MSRYSIVVDGGDCHEDHVGGGGGENLLKHGLDSQAACRDEDADDDDHVVDGCDGLGQQLHVQGGQTVCRAVLVMGGHVGNDTFLELYKES